MRPFPRRRKENQTKKEGETDWGEIEALGTPDLPFILPVDSVLYIMFPHNEKRGLRLLMM
jgi:hypothetical protein